METRAELRQIIDQLNNSQAEKVMAFVQSLLKVESDTGMLWEHLKTVPGIRLPANWRPPRERVQPVKLEEDESASEQLIQERRNKPHANSMHVLSHNCSSN